MVELSLKEQKQVNGGSFVVTVYDKSTGDLVKRKGGFAHFTDAQIYAETWNSWKYDIFVNEQ